MQSTEFINKTSFDSGGILKCVHGFTPVHDWPMLILPLGCVENEKSALEFNYAARNVTAFRFMSLEMKEITIVSKRMKSQLKIDMFYWTVCTTQKKCRDFDLS